MTQFKQAAKEYLLLLKLTAKVSLGHKFYLLPFLTIAWSGYHWLSDSMGWTASGYTAADAQNLLIGFPLYCLSIALGVSVIASEIEKRTLEVAYTVPEGCHRIWIAKLITNALILLIGLVILALITRILFTAYPDIALYAVLQGAIFHMIMAMGIAVMLKSELMAAMVSFLVLFVNASISDSTWSPLFNPLVLVQISDDELLSLSLQNHAVVLMFIIGITILSFVTIESREKMLF